MCFTGERLILKLNQIWMKNNILLIRVFNCHQEDIFLQFQIIMLLEGEMASDLCISSWFVRKQLSTESVKEQSWRVSRDNSPKIWLELTSNASIGKIRVILPQ